MTDTEARLKVEIDFDEASAEWRKNKKKEEEWVVCM